MMKRKQLAGSLVIWLVLLVSFWSGSASAGPVGTEVIRNGGFTNAAPGFPNLPADWSLAPTGAASLDITSLPGNNILSLGSVAPSAVGPALYQNMNVTGIAGATTSLNMLIYNYANISTGMAVGVSVEYYKTDGSRVVDIVKTFNNSDSTYISAACVPGETYCYVPVSVSSTGYTFPPDAEKLTKFIVQINEPWSNFSIDVVSFLLSSATVGPVPEITGLSGTAGPYGLGVTVTGTGFGETQGAGSRVLLNGSSHGCTVTSWSDTAVTFVPDDPAQPGAVAVVNDRTESDNRFTYAITSPTYTARTQSAYWKAIKGELAEFVVVAAFKNGFSTAAGIGFAINDNVQVAANAVFKYPPLKESGGVVVKINTAAMAPGRYNFTVTLTEPNTQPRYVPLTLDVVTVGDILFTFNGSPVTENGVLFTAQGRTYALATELRDSQGMPIVNPGLFGPPDNVTFTSSNPNVFGAYSVDMFGYAFFAVETGSANLVATTADGFTKSIPVTVTLPDSPHATLLLGKTTLPNIASTGTDATKRVSFSATYTAHASCGYSTIGNTGSLTENLSYAPDCSAGSGNFWLTGKSDFTYPAFTLPPSLGFVAISATDSDQLGARAEQARLLEIVNNPATAMIKGKAKDGTGSAERFYMEFYDATTGTFLFPREAEAFHGKPFKIPSILPGTYKIKVTSGPQNQQTRPDTVAKMPVRDGMVFGFKEYWYPNSRNFAGGQSLTFTAGQSLGDFYTIANAPVTAQQAAVFPPKRDFGVAVGGNQVFTITNTGVAVLSFAPAGAITVQGDAAFSQTTSCGISLDPGASCTVAVTFAPASQGPKFAKLVITTDDPANGVIEIPLSGQAPFITVVYPNGGEQFITGEPRTIAWSASPGVSGTVNLELWNGPDTKVSTIATGVATAAGQFTWAPAASVLEGDSYAIKIVSGTLSDKSDSYFFVSPPSLAVTSVFATMLKGRPVLITWDKMGNLGPQVKIELFKDNVFSRLIGYGITDSKSFSWNVPMDIADGTGYTIKLTSDGPPVLTAMSGSFVIAGVPAAPAGLTATVVAGPYVGLSWRDVTNETSYRLERTDDTLMSRNVNLPANLTAYTDRSVTPDKTYTYRLIAVNGNGDSNPSTTVIVKVPGIMSPTAPANLRLVRAGTNGAVLAWNDMSANENGFILQRSSSLSGPWTTVGGVPVAPVSRPYPSYPNIVQYNASGLASLTTYYFRVVSCIGAGAACSTNMSLPSNVLRVTTR